MSIKLIILVVLSFIMGLVFLIAGFYFLSANYINKLNQATSNTDYEKLAKNKIKAKGSGYISISFGAITIVWGIMMILFPPLTSILAFIYMIFLAAAFLTLYFIFK